MEILAGVAVDHSTWDDKLTTVNDYDDVQCHWPYSSSVLSSYWNCECLGGKTLYFTAATNNLLVKILGSLDEGVTFPVTVESEFSVAVGTPVLKYLSGYFNALKIQVKPAVAGAHGTLSVIGGGSSLPGITNVDVLSSALPTGAATAANQTTQIAAASNDGSVYENQNLATADTARRFETSQKKLKDVILQVSGYAQLFGDSSNQRYRLEVGGWMGFQKCDISTLYFKNATAGQNGTVNVIGVEE